MSRMRKGLGLAFASTLLAGGLISAGIAPASAQDASPMASPEATMPMLPAGCAVVAGELQNPRFVTIGGDGTVYVTTAGIAGDEAIYATPGAGTPAAAEAASMYGESGGVLAIAPDGTVSTAATGIPSFTFGTEVVGAAGIVVGDGMLYVAVGGAGPNTPVVAPVGGRSSVLAVDLASGSWTVLANLEAYEISDNPDPNHIDSDLYGMVMGTDGMLYVADAGGNDIIKVDPSSGEISTLAVIPGIPGPQANPDRGGAMEIDPVPTGLALAPDGGLYVSTLSGGPFIPGTASLLHVAMDGTVSTVASGLTMLGDVAVAADGSIYVVTMSENFIDPAGPAAGAIVKINADGTNQTVLSGIPFPGAIAFDADGNAYITAMVSLPAEAPAGGMVLKCDASVFAAMAAPEATPAG